MSDVIPPSASASTNADGEISMSIEETNALRISLGLKPLNDSKRKEAVLVDTSKGSSNSAEAVQERLNAAKARREEKERANKINAKALSEVKGAASGSAKDWVKSSRLNADKRSKEAKEREAMLEKRKAEDQKNSQYTAEQMSGMKVKHKMADFEEGESVILTLGDESILEAGTNGVYKGLKEGGSTLQNVEIAERERKERAERKKRKLGLMAMGGGYNGLDDDEFEELGGRGGGGPRELLKKYDEDDDGGEGGHGFTLTGTGVVEAGAGKAEKSDFDKQAEGGQALSLDMDYGLASDFMTQEEAEKKKGFKKKKKKDKEGKKKKSAGSKRKVAEAQPDDDEEDSGLGVDLATFKKAKKSSVLSSLLESGAGEEEGGTVSRADLAKIKEEKAARAAKREKERLEKFHATMQKGNERSRANVALNQAGDADAEMEDAPPLTGGGGAAAEEDPGLKAALAKAARMKKLKEMRARKKGEGGKKGVAALVEESKSAVTANGAVVGESKDEGMTVDFGTTAEFARKLGSVIDEQQQQQQQQASAGRERTASIASKEERKSMTMEEMEAMAKGMTNEEDMEAALAGMEDGEDEEGEIEEEDDVAGGMLGINSVGAGRGMAGVLSLLKSTGDLGGKSGGKEELKGRANDKKTYDDYKPSDLKSVVRIDKNKATDKDLLYSKKQINLEYRDDHGRLLTRKEAFRQLCYQFHGYGSGKKNEEKRLKKIRAENEAREKRINEDKGTMGSLRKTQAATGRAFVIHKT